MQPQATVTATPQAPIIYAKVRWLVELWQFPGEFQQHRQPAKLQYWTGTEWKFAETEEVVVVLKV